MLILVGSHAYRVRVQMMEATSARKDYQFLEARQIPRRYFIMNALWAYGNIEKRLTSE